MLVKSSSLTVFIVIHYQTSLTRQTAVSLLSSNQLSVDSVQTLVLMDTCKHNVCDESCLISVQYNQIYFRSSLTEAAYVSTLSISSSCVQYMSELLNDSFDQII